MRWVFLLITVVLVYGLSYVMAWALRWFMLPWWRVDLLPVVLMWFVVSSLILATLLMGSFRLATMYAVCLWLGCLAVVLTALFVMAAKMGNLHLLGYFDVVCRLVATVALVGVIGLALYNAYTPVVRHLSIQIDKPLPVPVRLAVASDLHLGRWVGVCQLDKLASLIQANHVDVLLIPGDVMDDDTMVFDEQGMASHLSKVVQAAPFGTVVSLGNHDLYRTQAYQQINTAITSSGAILLNDEHATLTISKNGQHSTLGVIGRFDDHQSNRLTSEQLLSRMDTSLPIILLDHRPSEIDKNANLPIDLQVSGHTHNGQIFPANLIVQNINRLGYGYEQINGSHFVVSSGYGFWGVPFRLGSQAEVWVIDVVGRSS